METERAARTEMISRFAKSFLTIIAALLVTTTLLVVFHPPSRSYIDPWTGDIFGEGGVERILRPPSHTSKSPPIGGVEGGVIMSKLGNATAKAALGRASWKLMHTMTLRYPEKPTNDEREALNSYFYLTSRLYPCGECATEFQALLKKFPPQTTSRRAASLWLCVVHNEVNKRLKKPEFDCAHLDAEYDCGCGDSPTNTTSAHGTGSTPVIAKGDPMDLEHDPSKDDVTGVRLIKGGR